MLEVARQAALDAGAKMDLFVADVAMATVASFPTHGGVAHSNVLGSTRGYAYGDHRYVRNNGTQSFGHEMGHGFGLDHSRADNPNVNLMGCQSDTIDYRDPWDKMSTGCDFFAADATYAFRGPGLNAWNMRGRGWLQEERVWKNSSEAFDSTVVLRPLHRFDLQGWLAAELPPLENGHGRYLVEFRLRDEWDAAIPRSCVMIHSFSANQSYMIASSTAIYDLVIGDTCSPWVDGKQFPTVSVVIIDEGALTATVKLSYSRT